ncbi:MAG: FTR1 family protein [Deltaproteobacteria bacterium]
MRSIRILGPLSLALLGVRALGEAADPAQLSAILGYVVSDYGTAVGARGVLDAEELREQQGFLAEAEELAAALPAVERAEVLPGLDAALAAAKAAAPAEAVVPWVQASLGALERRHPLAIAPREAPSLERGRALYAQGCVACHGASGHGDGESAAGLSTHPPDVSDPKQAGPLSPLRVFGAISYGVPGTSMPSYRDAWSERDRWDVAFALMALAHAGEPREPPGDGPPGGHRALPLSALSSTSDDGLRRELTAAGLSPPDVDRELGWQRREGSFRVAAPPLSACRASVAAAVARYASGDREGARREAIHAYLDELEPHEAGLRVRDSALVLELERACGELRSSIDEAEAPGVVALNGSRAEALLDRAMALESRGGAGVSFAAALAIALREGLEASLLLGALLALAGKARERKGRGAVQLGAAAALILGAATWWLSGALLARGGAREWIEGVVELVTALLLVGASHWVLAQAAAKRFMGMLARHAKPGAGLLGLFGLSFLALYREMAELVVFYRGLLLEAPGEGRAVVLGAAAGVVVLSGLLVVFQRLGHKLRPRPLLLVCGAILCGLSVVMVGEAIRSLQEAGAIDATRIAFPELPALGLFGTLQGLGAQAAVILALGASLARTLVGRRQPAPPEGAIGPRAA